MSALLSCEPPRLRSAIVENDTPEAAARAFIAAVERGYLGERVATELSESSFFQRLRAAVDPRAERRP